MKFPNLMLMAVGVLGSVTLAGLARAEGAAAEGAPAAMTPAPSPSDGHASGMMIQARVQSQTSLLSLSGGPGFLVGYQGPSYSLGVGLGLTRIGLSSGTGGNNSASATLFQIAPTVMVDVWHSRDGRARANLIGSVGYGRASLSATTQTQDCTGAGTTQSCTTTTQDTTLSASLIPVLLGFGGDYFLSRNFALGAEFGVQALFITGLNSDSGTASSSVNAAANAQFAYGALRATLVLGD